MNGFLIIAGFYKIVWTIINISILLFILKIICNIFFGNLISKYKKMNKEISKINLEELDNIETIVYVIIKLKKIDFFIIFFLYILIFKLIAPILIFLFFLNYLKILFKITKKNTIIEKKKISVYLISEISNYCSFIKIIKYSFLTIIDYSEIVTLSNVYAILKKEEGNKNIKIIIEKIIISRIVGLSYKYIKYSIKITDFFIKEFQIKIKDKKFPVKIKTFLKMLIKSPIMVITSSRIIPTQVWFYNRKIIKENWKIKTNPLPIQNYSSFIFKFIANREMFPVYIKIKDKLENQRAEKIHQAAVMYSKENIWLFKFTSSPIVLNKKTIHLYNYYTNNGFKSQFYKLIQNEEILKENKENWQEGFLRNFYILHKIGEEDGWMAFYIRLRIELELEKTTGKNKEDLLEIKKIINPKELIEKSEKTTYLKKIIEDGYKFKQLKEVQELKEKNEEIFH